MLLLDNSAWARIEASSKLGTQRRAWLAELLAGAQVVTCLPFLLEAGYSARSGPDHRRIMADLGGLPSIEITPAIEELAVTAQGELATVGHHRLPPIDLLIAACAHQVGAGVLHYDADFDRILEHTSLRFESDWLAPRGSL